MKKVIMSFAAGVVLLGASATSASAAEYKVEEGDTLSAIGQEYNVSVDQLMSWNDLTSDLIIVDQMLDIHDGKSSDNSAGNVEQASQTVQIDPEPQEDADNEGADQEAAENDDNEASEDNEAPAEEQPKEQENADQQAAEPDEKN